MAKKIRTLDDIMESFKPEEEKETPENELQRLLSTQTTNLAARLGAVGAEGADDRGPIGRFLNLEQNQGFGGDLFEILDRAGQATKGALAASSTGKDVGQEFLKGLTGQVDRTGAEFLDEVGILSKKQFETMSGFEQFIVNVGTDMITDPLNLLPAGFFTSKLAKLSPFKVERVIRKVAQNADALKLAKQSAWETAQQAGGRVDEVIDTLKQTKKFGDKKARREAIKLVRKELGFVDDVKKFDAAYKATQDQIDDLVKRIDEMVAAGKTDDQIIKSLNAGDAELLATNRAMTRFENIAKKVNLSGSNYRVSRIGGSAPGRQDVGFFLQTDAGDWFKVASVEVKNATSGFAYGKTVILKQTKNGLFQFGDNVKIPDEVKTTIQNTFKGLKTSDGRPIAELVDSVIRNDVNSVELLKNLKAADRKLVEDGIKEIYRQLDLGYVYILAKDGSENLVRFSDVLDDLDFEVLVKYDTTRKQDRLFLNMGLDNAYVGKKTGKVFNPDDEVWDELLGQVLNTPGGRAIQETTVMQRTGFLTWAARQDNAFQPTAKKLKELVDSVANLFSPFRQFDDETRNMLRRIPAESREIIYQQNKQFLALSEQALKVSPEGPAIIQELIAAGAKLEDGKIVLDITYNNMGNYLRTYMDEFLKNGTDAPIFIYGGRTSDNVLYKMNKAYEDAGGVANAFKIKEKNGSFFFSLDQASPDEAKSLIGKGFFDDIEVGMGRKQLTNAQRDFYLNNAELVEQYKKTYADLIDTFRKELGPENIPDFIKTTNGYTRNVLTKEGAEWLKSNLPLSRSKFVREGIDMLAARKYYGTPDDINKAMRAYYDIDFDFFDTNITHSLQDLLRVAVTKNESGRVLEAILKGSDEFGASLFQVVDNKVSASIGENFEYFQDFSQEFSKLYENMAPDARKVLDTYLANLGMGQGKSLALHQQAFNTLKRFEKAYVEVPQLLKDYDKLINTWKSLNLVTPSFHINNFIGNSVNSFLVGMGVADQGKYLSLAQSDLTQYDGLLGKINNLINQGIRREDALKQLSQTELDTYERLLRYFNDGVSMKRAGVRDLNFVNKTLEDGGQKGLYQGLLEANFNLAENADELQRYALYQWAYDNEFIRLGNQGLDSTNRMMKARNFATNKTFESLFDYSTYTRFEQDVMKRLFPFYTFAKNNLVFQMRNIVDNPGQYAKLGRAYDYYVSDIAGLTDDDMPEYARDNMWLPIPIELNRNDKEMVTFLRTNLPPAEFAEMIESRGARGVSSLTVPLKLPIELALNRDIFTGAEIKEFPGQIDRMAKDEGMMPFFRDSDGAFTISGDPTIQKIANDLGLRVPSRYITTALDIADSRSANQDPLDAFYDALDNLGITSMKSKEDINITNFYQALEQYRYAEKRWEQESGKDLPTKAELGLP